MFAGVSIPYFSLTDVKYSPMDCLGIILLEEASVGSPARAEIHGVSVWGGGARC